MHQNFTSLSLGAPAAIAFGLWPFTAAAAVRVCYPSISSEVMSAATELEAKKLALLQWQEKASKYGPAMDAWRLAADKALKCYPGPKGFDCVAIGEPCIIQNNPNQVPVGTDRKGEPL